MSGNDDDEALTWAGGRDPSHYETPEAKPQKSRVQANEKGRGDGRSRSVEDVRSSAAQDDDEDARPVTSSAVLVSMGILGGVYLLYTVGWFISWQRLLYSSADELELIAFHVQQVLAIIAPALWFGLTLFLTRDRKPTVRLLVLLIGALVLIPWPFVFGS